jgi:hypothetical protein
MWFFTYTAGKYAKKNPGRPVFITVDAPPAIRQRH